MGSSERFLQLDSLRGVACLMVLLAHLKAVKPLAWIPDVTGVAGVGIFSRSAVF
jgi:peptidoglycan/LPS O-acetylase OafA/YrhL